MEAIHNKAPQGTPFTYQQIWDFYLRMSQVERTLEGKFLYGNAVFRNINKELGVRFNSINDKMRELNKKYFIIEDNQIAFHPPLLDENNKPVGEPIPKMLDGMLLEDFNKEHKELMQTVIFVK